jgi:uncharacterized protein YcbK (DUF882 family)
MYDWNNEFLIFFTKKDCLCPCGCGNGIEQIKPETKHNLYLLRSVLQMPIYPTSGFRCVEHNKTVSKTNKSEHLFGNAFDIRCSNSTYRALILKYALSYTNFKRIGVYKDIPIIHLGLGWDLAEPIVYIE